GGITIGAFRWGQSAGLPLEASCTIAVNTLVVGQIFYLLASRYTRTTSLRRDLITTNPISWLCIALMLALQAAFVHVPFMQIAFASGPVGAVGWLVPLGAGLLVFAVVAVDRALRRGREGAGAASAPDPGRRSGCLTAPGGLSERPNEMVLKTIVR